MSLSTKDEYEQFMWNYGEIDLNDCHIIFVCNTKDNTKIKKNYENFSIDSEFLSTTEFNQIQNILLDLDIPFDIYYDEKEFMEYVIKNESRLKSKNTIIYSSAQNGVGAGRKSLIPSFCSYFGLRHTGTDAYHVSLCRSKFDVVQILLKTGLPVPRTFLYNAELKLKQGCNYIAKPVYESASIGISSKNKFKGNDIPHEYLNNLSNTLNQHIIVQEFINGYEIEVPVLCKKSNVFCFDPITLSLDESSDFMGSNFLDYDKIYNDNYIFQKFKSDKVENIKTLAAKTVKRLSLNGLCRVDFRLKKNGTAFITDVSTNPHFINPSSVNFAFKSAGLRDQDIMKAIIKLI